MKTVNKYGLDYINDCLRTHHKTFLGEANIPAETTSAWAQDVEQALLDGAPAQFEISRSFSVSGHPKLFTLDSYMIDEPPAFFRKDQNWDEESTTYWFHADDGDFGIRESGPIVVVGVVGSDGEAVTDPTLKAKVLASCVVTDELRDL